MDSAMAPDAGTPKSHYMTSDMASFTPMAPELRGIGITQRPPSFTSQQTGNPGQKQHQVLNHLSQKCPRSSTAFEDGGPFTLQKQDATAEQRTNHTDTLSQSINTHSPVAKLYCPLVIIMSVF